MANINKPTSRIKSSFIYHCSRVTKIPETTTWRCLVNDIEVARSCAAQYTSVSGLRSCPWYYSVRPNKSVECNPFARSVDNLCGYPQQVGHLSKTAWTSCNNVILTTSVAQWCTVGARWRGLVFDSRLDQFGTTTNVPKLLLPLVLKLHSFSSTGIFLV